MAAVERTRPDLALFEVELPELHGAGQGVDGRLGGGRLRDGAERLTATLDRVRRLVATRRRPASKRRLLVKSNKRLHLVRASDIDGLHRALGEAI